MVEPILQGLRYLDAALVVQLPATLAGLTLTALTFLTLRLGELRKELLKLTAKLPLGLGMSESEDQPKELKGKITDVQEAASLFYRAFVLFLGTLVLMLAVFDSVLEANTSDLATELADVVGTGTPFAVGLFSMLQGARKIKKQFIIT